MRSRLATLLMVTLGTLAHGSGDAATTERPDATLRALLVDAVRADHGFEDRFAAEVWFLDMATRLAELVPEPELRLAILQAVHREASRANLSPELVLAVITVESRFDRFALSTAGARGLMQIMPFWLREIGQPDANLFHIDTNLAIGCTILRHYLDLERENLHRALARYNGSLGQSWYPRRVMRAYRRTWQP